MARRVDRAPLLDGKVGAKEYGGEPDAMALRETHGRKEPEFGTRFRVGYDDKAVYIAVTAAEQTPGKLPQSGEMRDYPLIRKDDNVEVVIDWSGRGKERLQFVGNLAGVRYEARRGDAKWDADWAVAVGWRDDEYAVEFQIPYNGGRGASDVGGHHHRDRHPKPRASDRRTDADPQHCAFGSVR